MSKTTKKRYTSEFKVNAVCRVKEVRSISAVAKELGLAEQTLRKWVQTDPKNMFGQLRETKSLPRPPSITQLTNAPNTKTGTRPNIGSPVSFQGKPTSKKSEVELLKLENASLKKDIESRRQAATHEFQDIPIKLGDTIQDVQKAFATSLVPEPLNSPEPTMVKRTQLRLKTKGIWVFFEKGTVYTFRVDPPFSGSISGIVLGDTYSKLQSLLGSPIRQQTIGLTTAYTYYFDDVTTTRFIINRDDEIETIFFHK